MTALTSRDRIVLVILMLVLYLALAFGIYAGLTQRVLGANDFYSRWKGAQALFLRGENPYSDAVTREIQLGMYGRLARPGEDQVAYAYPLYSAFAIAPLVVLPYAQAQALWMALLIFCAIGGGLGLAQLYTIRLKPFMLAALVLSILLFYPAVRGIFNGQFALVSFFCLALAMWLIQIDHDVAAGCLLALATLKPQPAIFLVPVIIFWAWRHRRLKIVISAIKFFSALIIVAAIWIPTWLFDFLNALIQYADYLRVGPPVQTVAEILVPDFSFPMTLIIGAALIGWMVWRVIRSVNQSWQDFLSTLGLVALITTLTAGRVGTPDQMLLLVPWLGWFAADLRRGQIGRVALLAFIQLVVPWVVFLTTLRGDAEHVVVTLVLPWLTFGVFLVQAFSTTRGVRR